MTEFFKILDFLVSRVRNVSDDSEISENSPESQNVRNFTLSIHFYLRRPIYPDLVTIFLDDQFDEESVDMDEDDDIGFDEDDADNMGDEWDPYDDEYEDDYDEEYDDEYYDEEEDEWGLGDEDNGDYSVDNLGEPSIDDQGSQDNIGEARNHYEAMVRPSIIHNLIIIYNMRYLSSTSYSDRIL